MKPDLVHLLTIKPVIWGGLAARLAGVSAVVSTITGLGQVFVAKGGPSALLRRFVVGLYRQATDHRNARVIVQNSGDAKVLREMGAVDRSKIRLIRGSGVSLDEFVDTPFAEGPPLVILPARLIWEKGVGVFVEAARSARQQMPDARFALIGDTRASNPRAVPEDVINSWVEEGVVEWWGRRTDMPAVLAAATIVCLPSAYGEGVPKVLIEAAACARPIIASDIAGCREVVFDGENGILVSPNDAGALSGALVALLGNWETCVAMGRRGREIVTEGFTVERVIADTLAVYDEIQPSES